MKNALLALFLLIPTTAMAQIDLIDIDFDVAGGYTLDPAAECTETPATPDYYFRTDGTDLNVNTNYTGIMGSFFAAEDTDSCGSNPTTITLTSPSVSIAGCMNLTFSGFFAEDDAIDGAEDWDTTSSVRVRAIVDGVPGDIFAIQSELGLDGNETNEVPRVDTDLDGVGDGAEITDTFAQFTANIANGSTLVLEVVIQDLNTGDEDIAFDEILVTGDCVLPVEMSDLRIESSNLGARLVWETYSESNNAGFEVQQSSSDSFTSIGFVEGAGNSDSERAYEYSIDDLSPGRNVFRIKQIDFDGGFSFSNSIETIGEIPSGINLSAAYPNPFNPTTQFDFVVAEEQVVEINLMDVSGKMVKSVYTGVADANQIVNVSLDASGLPSGLYYFKLSGSLGANATRSVVLMK